ncbi:HAMP domain-containing histidine kinase [Lutimonas saemankumensis]|uniref:sensor histidine kinase n=1 Tax=Lutimonas saemankumensis TaxID=483016 RepID=UPI001CD4FC78|nr:HAMP domain-containing sensor histidine kinase [Lutimonas saemankumensis]MCA0931485.1 HAMP domain-containing histidine kinase [Lutimonas saemankumensis]
MSKRIFVLLVVLMVISLLGIITVQIFWIRSSIEMREEQFSTSVKFALARVSENIQKREFKDNISRYAPMIDSMQKSKQSNVRDFVFQQIDTSRNEIFTYRQSILENNYKSQISPFETDTVNFKTFLSREETQVEKIEFNSKDFSELSPKDRMIKVERLDKYDKLELEGIFKNIVARTPIHDRVSANEIRMNLDNELRARNIQTKFEFGVFNEDLITKVKSDRFVEKRGYTYNVPLFVTDDIEDYTLFVSFPEKKEYILSTISWILILSALFIFIIILSFASALYQLIKQKQISEIKTDFINNMTHEFKTPIATINLAIDSIRNPKIIGDKEKVIRYSQMIREENKRMHAQVENVLRISKLEKNQLDLSKDVVDLHDIIEDAVSHVSLIIKDREGEITLSMEAKQSEISASRFHMTNVVTNMLDNAIKYSEGSPIIKMETVNAGNSIVLKITDKGIGMSKNVQRKVFNKFYREQTGNVHNVKGHGLGLSYVKSIVEKHHGQVYVESEKGKGSTFTMKLPII